MALTAGYPHGTTNPVGDQIFNLLILILYPTASANEIWDFSAAHSATTASATTAAATTTAAAASTNELWDLFSPNPTLEVEIATFQYYGG